MFAFGPFTTLQPATRLDSTLPSKYKNLVVMGGAIRGTGNVTSVAEFNAYVDPEAAAVLFEAWPGLTLISWETTVAHAFTAKQVKTLMAMDSPRAEFFRRITKHKINFAQQSLGKRVLTTADGLAVAVALEPDIVRKAEARHIQVELTGRYSRGQTVVDWNNQTGLEPNANLVLEVDNELLWELMQAALL